MATVSPHGKGWRAQIRRRGYPALSKTFRKKSQAWAWADKSERELLEGRLSIGNHTVGDALERYAREDSPEKGGARWEKLRIKAFVRHPVAKKKITALTADDMERWRDDRLGVAEWVTGTYKKPVKGATVRRELNLWDSALEKARRTWKWIQANPMRDVKKPPDSKPRAKGIPPGIIEPMRKALDVGPASREVFKGWILGMRTAMRAGEMFTLERPQIDLRARVAHLLKTKNGDERDVPLFPEALKIVKGLLADGRERLFMVDNESRDTLFREARKATGLEGFTFHDSRSEGISWLSKRMDVLELARVVGHRDINSLLIYYRASAAEIARRRSPGASPRNRPTPHPRTSGGVRRGPSGGRGAGSRGRR